MGEFEAVLRGRVAQAVAALKMARDAGDEEAAEVAAGSLGSLLTIAAEHAVDISAELAGIRLEGSGGTWG